MARIAGVDIPRNKRVEVALTYIFGIGPTSAKGILTKTNVDPDTRVNNLTEDEVNRIRETVDKEYTVEGDLRRQVYHEHQAPDRDQVLSGHQAPAWPACTWAAHPHQRPHPPRRQEDSWHATEEVAS